MRFEVHTVLLMNIKVLGAAGPCACVSFLSPSSRSAQTVTMEAEVSYETSVSLPIDMSPYPRRHIFSVLLLFPRMLLRHLAEILMYRVWFCKLACHLHAIYGIDFLETVRTENVNPCLDLVSYYGRCNVQWPAVKVWHSSAAHLFPDLGFL
jgi:hypothetical protein